MGIYKDYRGKGFTINTADLKGNDWLGGDSVIKRLTQITLTKSELVAQARDFERISNEIKGIIGDKKPTIASIFGSRRLDDYTMGRLRKINDGAIFEAVLRSGLYKDLDDFSDSLARCARKLNLAAEKEIAVTEGDITDLLVRDFNNRKVSTLYDNIRSRVFEPAAQYGKSVAAIGLTAAALLSVASISYDTGSRLSVEERLKKMEELRYLQQVEALNLNMPTQAKLANFTFNDSDPLVLIPSTYEKMGGKGSSYIFKSPTSPNQNLFTIEVRTSSLLGDDGAIKRNSDQFSLSIANVNDAFGGNKSLVKEKLTKIFVDDFYKNSNTDGNVYDKLDSFKRYSIEKMEILSSAKDNKEFIKILTELAQDKEVAIKNPEPKMRKASPSLGMSM